PCEQDAARADPALHAFERAEAEQRDHTDEAGDETDHAPPAYTLVYAHQWRYEDDDHRHAREQDARDGRAHPAFALCKKEKRPDELDDREHRDDAPVLHHSLELAAPQRYGNEQQRGADQPPPGHPYRRELMNRVLYEEIRRAPDDADR